MPKALIRRRSSTLSYFPPRPRERLPRRRCEADAEELYRKEKLGHPGPVDVWLATRMAQDHIISIPPSPSPDSSAGGGGWPSAALRGDDEDEVLCTVQLQCIKAPDDPSSIFADPDTFLLHLTTVSISRDGPEARSISTIASTSTSTSTSSSGGRSRTGDENDSPTPSSSSSFRFSSSVSGSAREESESDAESDSKEASKEASQEDAGRVRRAVLARYEGHAESPDAPRWTRLPAGAPVVFRERAGTVADVLVRAALWRDCMTPLLESLRAAGLDADGAH